MKAFDPQSSAGEEGPNPVKLETIRGIALAVLVGSAVWSAFLWLAWVVWRWLVRLV